MSENNTMELVREGLMKLAFGEINDAVRLAFDSEAAGSEIRALDLFNVEAIKISKDGAVEMRFADRLSALDKLRELDSEIRDENSAGKMLSMIYGGQGGESDDG